MKSNNIIVTKSYKFALRIIKLSKYLIENKKDYILSKCGTSIGANIKEAVQAESKKDFIHKMNIALKESSETEYWLDLLRDSEIIEEKSYKSLNQDCIELMKLLTSIIKTSRSKLNTK